MQDWCTHLILCRGTCVEQQDCFATVLEAGGHELCGGREDPTLLRLLTPLSQVSRNQLQQGEPEEVHIRPLYQRASYISHSPLDVEHQLIREDSFLLHYLSCGLMAVYIFSMSS